MRKHLFVFISVHVHHTKMIKRNLLCAILLDILSTLESDRYGLSNDTLLVCLVSLLPMPSAANIGTFFGPPGTGNIIFPSFGFAEQTFTVMSIFPNTDLTALIVRLTILEVMTSAATKRRRRESFLLRTRGNASDTTAVTYSGVTGFRDRERLLRRKISFPPLDPRMIV